MLSNIESLFLYIVIYIISAAFIHISKKREGSVPGKFLFVIGLLLPVLLAYFRVNVGTDYLNYQLTYRSYSSMSFISFVTSRELFYGWGVWLLSKIAYFIGGEKTFFALFALLTSIFAFKGIERFEISNWFIVSLAFYLGPFTGSLNIMKQALAVSIVFWGIRYVEERKLLKYSIVVLIAVLFHTTALIALPIYFIYDTKNDEKIWNLKSMFYIVLTGIVVANLMNILAALRNVNFMNLSRFASYSSGEGTGNLTFFLTLIEFVIVLIHQKGLVYYSNKYKLLIVLMGVGLCFDAVGFVSVFVKRISSYYSTYPFIILFSNLSETNYTKRSKVIVYTLVGLFLLIIFFISYYVRGFGNIIPYQYL